MNTADVPLRRHGPRLMIVAARMRTLHRLPFNDPSVVKVFLRIARRQVVRSLVTLVVAGIFTATQAGDNSASMGGTKPNVIVVLVDDMGWRDLACQGSPFFETPHIDRLAASGMRFTQGYTACTVCSPTRAAMMTGQYPARLHITDWIPGHQRTYAKLSSPEWQKFLPLETVTVAERLRSAGYATACIGKWHLGGKPYYPEQQGFDSNIGGCDRGQPPSYFSPYKIPTLPDGPAGEYLTDREAAEAVNFIEAHRDRPFFLYLPHYCVHTPIQAKPAVKAKYAAKVTGGLAENNAGYAAMVESVDDCMGRVLATLDRLGIRDSTAIFFTSDNGGLVSSTDNTPARAGKGSAFEGGVRVPFIVSWPGVTRPGTTSAEPAITPDIPATILDLTGAGPEPGQPLDGVSLAPAFRGEPLGRDALYWHYPHYHPGGATPYSAIRSGEWRLVRFYEDGRRELYNLRADEGETIDRAAHEPDRVAALTEKLDAWLTSVGAQLPTPNPHHDPARDAPARGRLEPAAATAPVGKLKSPNVLFVIADDASSHFGCYGCGWARTPAVDRLAREGLAFDNAYVPTSKCAPCRAAILTGRNPWQLEAAANHWPTFPPEYRAFTEVLADSGIACGSAGKVWGPGVAQTADGDKRTWGLATGKRGAGMEAGAALREFLATRTPGQPFFYWCGSTNPHRKYAPDAGLAAGKKPSDIDRVPACWPDTDVVRRDMLDYATEVEAFDAEVGSLLAALDAGPTKAVIEAAGEGDHFWQLCFGKRPADELYDLAADPDCVQNLAADPAQADHIRQLKEELFAELTQQEDPRLLGRGDAFDRYPSPQPRPAPGR